MREGVVLMIYDNKIKNRIKRTEGQLRGILNMMDEEMDCTNVAMQLSAVRAAVDRTIGLIASENLVSCMNELKGDGSEPDEAIQEAINLVVKSR